jgi:ParB family chromosome partitioning protein
MARPVLAVHPRDETPPGEVERLAAAIENDGGAALATYRDPVGGHWQIFALLPLAKVQPTPYQRDLSKAHAARLLKVIKKIDRFVDPVVAVRSGDGYWTPNGNHRRYVLEKLKAELVPAIVVPEVEVAFQILALNTEKAHNLKEKSLEVIRMVRGLIEEGSRKDEETYAFQFEEPHFITLGLLYEKNARFAGGAYAPFLRRVDKFLKEPLKAAYAVREKRAARVEEADMHLKKAVDALKRRGLNHPFMKNYVLARCNPLSRARKTVPGFEQAIARLVDNLAAFDPQKVRQEDIARSAVLSIPAAS